MANYAPPTEETPIFNGKYFTGVNITTQNGDGRYLKLLAQGDEDMNDNDILNVNQAEVNSVKFSDNTIQTTAFSGSVGGVPAGSMITFCGGGTIPSGYLVCDGSPVLEVDYPDLFSAIGTTYGNPGGNRFNLPDMTNRFIMGATQSIGLSGGSNSDFITEANITQFPLTQTPPPNNPANTTISFNSTGGISNWKYIKGKPSGDSSQDMWLPLVQDDNANGDITTNQFGIGTGTSAFDKKPFHYLMVYIIKT
jgi:hypothetical protein